MITVGLTGGIGSGKTTVAQVFQILGIPVYNSDTEAKRLMHENTTLKNALKRNFGADIYDTTNTLNRQQLANIVFHDKTALAKLNTLVHPAVRTDFKLWVEKQTSSFVIQESAILIETGIYKNFDFIIGVFCPMDERIERLLQRDQSATKESIYARIKMQISETERRKFLNAVLKNGKDDLLLPQIRTLNKKITEIC